MSEQSVDGRTARRDRNRQEVVEAALTLLDEGEVDPTVEQLTKRSGLSARSIFRYFEGLDDLRRAVISNHFERMTAQVEVVHPGGGPLEDRIRHFVDARIKLNESLVGTARTARLRAPYAPVIADDIRRYRKRLDSQVREYFGPELRSHPKAEADDLMYLIDVLVSFDSWDLLAREYARSRSQLRRAWTLALTRLLAPGPGRSPARRPPFPRE